MQPTQISEEDLIAYQLGELPRLRTWQIRRELERNPALVAEAEEIAATLRAFSADSTTIFDDQASARAWHALRPSLLTLTPGPASRTKIWAIAATGALAGALAVFAAISLTHRSTPIATVRAPRVTSQELAAAREVTSELNILHTPEQEATQQPTHTARFISRPGPLTLAPVDAVAADPRLAHHLDAAERVLTEVSHTEGQLPIQTQQQVHHLLLENAIYHQAAEQRGDLAVAGVIDDLGRILTVLDAEPQQNPDNADSDAFRLQMNMGGVLLDLRILHHNAKPGRE